MRVNINLKLVTKVVARKISFIYSYAMCVVNSTFVGQITNSGKIIEIFKISLTRRGTLSRIF